MILIAIARKMLNACFAALAVLLLSVCAAVAQEAPKPVVDPASSQDEIRQFCTNIADPARDQRYLLQKQELEKLQADVDQRIATMDKRKAEYEDWLKRRDDFLKTADSGLVDIYKNMKPDAAAASLDGVKVTVAAAIIMKLSPRQSSLILAEMDAQKAAVVTNIIASASDPNTSKSKDPS
ncbi:MotE family protein [Rhizobium sp.]|uniref:MotE family protein n=1 Tax=Rhizobium sp. TaxID=391 RepID=UPI002F241CB0